MPNPGPLAQYFPPDHLSATLQNPSFAPRYVAEAQRRHLARLPCIFERHEPSTARPSCTFVRNLLTKVGLVSRSSTSSSSEQLETDFIVSHLGESRVLIETHTRWGIDDIPVDAHLGIGTEECILPPPLRIWHEQFRQQNNQPQVSFLRWVAHHADDDQLLAVWRWHDAWLDERDSDPVFQEQVQTIKTQFTAGLRQAIEAGVLHPDLARQEADISTTRIVHGSPLSPLLAEAPAFKETFTNTIHINPGVSDFTLYCELTSILGGFGVAVNNEVTRLIASEIYRHSPASDGQHTPDYTADRQPSILDVFGQFDAATTLHSISMLYAKPATPENVKGLSNHFDAILGLPLFWALLVQTGNLTRRLLPDMTIMQAERQTQQFAYEQLVFFASIMFDSQGNRLPDDDLGQRVREAAAGEQHDKAFTTSSLTIALMALEWQAHHYPKGSSRGS